MLVVEWIGVDAIVFQLVGLIRVSVRIVAVGDLVLELALQVPPNHKHVEIVGHKQGLALEVVDGDPGEDVLEKALVLWARLNHKLVFVVAHKLEHVVGVADGVVGEIVVLKQYVLQTVNGAWVGFNKLTQN